MSEELIIRAKTDIKLASEEMNITHTYKKGTKVSTVIEGLFYYWRVTSTDDEIKDQINEWMKK